jgi:phosphatidylinositol 4-kinase A
MELSLQTDALIEQLSTLLLPIAAVIDEETFTLNVRETPELVVLFRNMWFLCVLFGFTSPGNPLSLSSTLKDALVHIAVKTPPIVREEESEYLTSALEYNSVLRHDYAQNVPLFFLFLWCFNKPTHR